MGGIITSLNQSLKHLIQCRMNEWSLSKEQLSVVHFAAGYYLWIQELFCPRTTFRPWGLCFICMFYSPITKSSTHYLSETLILRHPWMLKSFAYYSCGKWFLSSVYLEIFLVLYSWILPYQLISKIHLYISF